MQSVKDFLSRTVRSLTLGTTMASPASPASPARFDVKSVAVIGAGPSGLSAARYLRAQGTFDRIVIFEKQDEVGGVWYYNAKVPGPYPVPQLDPFLEPDPPVERGDGSGKAPVFPSPMYDKLHANIPGSLMNFSDKKFPQDAWLFPQRETIQDYLVEYAAGVRDAIRFCLDVTKVSRTPADDGTDKWLLEARSTVSDEVVRDTFDAVVVANGHYATPYIPSMKQISAFNDAHPSVITHSKHFRTAEPFRGKKVIVVGNGPSGTDIAYQVNRASAQPVLLSVREATPADRLEYTGCREVPPIDEFLVEERGVRFTDGTVETGVDAVLFCTGFLFSYPFLRDLDDRLITNGRGVHGLYKHLFSVDHPTLAFPGLNIKAIPWPVTEAQAAVFSAVWSNQLELPGRDEMDRWTRELEAAKGDKIHVFAPLEDGRYINEMHDWAVRARSLGKEPPRWDDEAFWERRLFAEAKLRFEQTGCRAKTLEELGFHYDAEAAAGGGEGQPAAV